jgi:Zn-dependent protease
LFNLLPVWPLDGGQITRELVYKFGGSLYNASVISLVAAIAVAAWFYSIGSWIGAILFASFAVTNYQMMNTGGRW